ncbi:MAG: apolipoprotein N-acyltransferase [Pseudomonadota bacterium]
MTEMGARLAAPGDLAARVAALKGWRRLVLAIATGAVLAAGHQPIGVPATAFLALPVIVWLVGRAETAGRAALAAWAVGFGYLIVSLHWVGHAFLVDADAYAWLLPVAVTLLPAGLALFWALAGWIARRVAGPADGGLGADLRLMLVLAGALTLTEGLRGHVLTGFPWALPGYLWAETALAQLSAWIGPYGLTLVTLIGAALPGLGAAQIARHPRSGMVATMAGVLLFAGAWGAGSWRMNAAPAGDAPPDATVIRLVQPNAPQHLKWQRDWIPTFYARLLEGSAAPADPTLGAPDLVIWPETAVAFLPAEQPAARAQMVSAAGAPLILGALHAAEDATGRAFSNALFVLGEGGRIDARYDKHHLVPFGEYMPLRSVFAALGIEQLAQRGRFEPGPGPSSLSLPGMPSFVPLICYEAIFPGEVAAAVATGEAGRPAYLLQITNDAWFGTLGGPQQHLAQARLRAIEQGLPLVRAANTGISAVIDAHGRVTASLGLGQHGYLDARLPVDIGQTLYADLGDLPSFVTAFLLFVARFVRPSARVR